jgi:hypothetical protein
MAITLLPLWAFVVSSRVKFAFNFSFTLCIVSYLVYSCLFLIFVQVYCPLSPGGNPIAVNKYHIIRVMNIVINNTFACLTLKTQLPRPAVPYTDQYFLLGFPL